MSQEPNRVVPPSTSDNAGRSGNGRATMLWGGSALIVVLVGLAAWLVSPLSPLGTRQGPTPTPTPTSIVAEATSTPPAGAATFTPVPGQVTNGPHVTGITAGVGMRTGDVAGKAEIAVSFSDVMDQAAAQSAFSLSPSVDGAFTWKDKTLLFSPGQSLSPSTSYTVTLASSAKTSSGQALVAPLAASFKTAPPPSILRTLPSEGASEVPTDTVVTISFNRPMIPLTSLDNQPDVSQWVTINPAVKGRWVWLGTGAVGFRAEAGFLPATAYTVEAKAGWPDGSGVALPTGVTFHFTTIKPAITSVSPSNGASLVMIDSPVVVRFNMAMEHDSVQRSFTLHVSSRNAALTGSYAWSPGSTVMTFTAGSLLEFSQDYSVLLGGQVKPLDGNATELAGGPSANSWDFQTTDSTRVIGHYPDTAQGPAQPTDNFGFSFNNPLAPGQDVAKYLTISPVPGGYIGQLEVSSSNVFTHEVQLAANTTYTFDLAAGLKDKWGFPVAPARWQVNIGPLPPSFTIKGGNFQPLYSHGTTRVRIDATNLSTIHLHLSQLSEADLRTLLLNPSYGPTPTYPGQLKREWDVQVPPGDKGQSTIYPVIALDGKADRLPPGFYLLRADAPTPYSDYPLQGATVLLVGQTGVVTKSDGDNLLVWAADLGSGKPVANYPLRIEQLRYANSGDQLPPAVVQRVQTGSDGVVRLKLNQADNVAMVTVWSEQPGDAMFANTGWTNNLDPWNFNVPGAYGSPNDRGTIYTDRPIYRPEQKVYFRGIYRLDDDASYSLPKSGLTVNVRASTYGNGGETRVYTGTATLSSVGTFSGDFTLPVNAPIGSYSLSFAPPGTDENSPYYSGASVSFDVQEYRKPDFQVNVSTGGNAIHGDPVTATISTSYYFGGPLANITTTVNLQASDYYFTWSDPDTGENYVFGEGYPHIYDYYSPYPYQTPEPVQSFQALTDKDGNLTVDVSKYVTTTNGSKSVLIEGHVQDLSNQAVANSATTIVHQGQYYVGINVADYIATAKQPTTITVRTVNWDGKQTVDNRSVSLRFVRREWSPPATVDGQWKLNEVPVGQGTVTTDSKGRATFLFTPPTGGDYWLVAESTDSRGNVIRTETGFWATSKDAGYVPWRLSNDQQVQLVADKKMYTVGDTAHILVTSPFTQATGLLTVERGHVRRYSIVNIQGGAPTIDVPLVDGDLPNVFVSLTLLGPERPPDGAPADWANKAVLRQGYVDLTLDTSGEKLQVSLQPQGQGPFAPGSTATVVVRAQDSSGKPVAGDFSLAVVDEAIFALSGDKTAELFGTFWSERGLGVRTSSSFTAGEGYAGGRGGAGDMASGGAPAPNATSAASAPEAQTKAANGGGGAAPAKVRTNFQDTAFWIGSVTTGDDGSATVSVPLPDNLTTWRLTAQAITGDTKAGAGTGVMTVTQPLLLRPVLPRFFTTGDNPQPQAIIHNNTTLTLDIEASLEVSGAISLAKGQDAVQTLKVAPGAETVVTWNATVGGGAGGDVANLRFWVHTVPPNGTYYLEDAVAAHLPVKPFAAPEAVATSGEVSGTQADESIFLPYSTNPLLGELVIQVSPSLAASTNDSLVFLHEYEYDSTDMAVSRFLPLVVMEQVYNEQGVKTPYSSDIPSIVDRSVKRLRELQQADGGWAWWERGPSSWFETAYAVQGLTALRDAGYSSGSDMLQRGIERLRSFMQDNSTQGIDETYHLNMRAYTVYVLANALGNNSDAAQEGTALLNQTSRLSAHARAWLAMGLAKLGAAEDSKKLLDSLVSAARQTSTTAHWEEGTPDYWSMGTDNRATALAIDALVTLSPDDPLVPKAVRWLMSAEKEGHWLSTQETSISLIALAHYIRQSKELQANYTWQVDAFDKLLGQGAANGQTLTQTVTLRMPVSDMPQNSAGALSFARSGANGKMYYQASLRYYVPGEGIKSRSERLAISRSYYIMQGGGSGTASTDPVKEAQAGDLVKIRLTIAVPETSYYVLVTDPLPAGLEGVNGSLNTTSFTERPPSPSGVNVTDKVSAMYGDWFWRWGPFDNVEMRDDRTVLFATYMSPGTYVYEYFARATTPGVYMSLPAHAELLYYPDVFGHSDGGQFTVK